MIEHVDADRLRDLTLELVEIARPTGDTDATRSRRRSLLRQPPTPAVG